MTALTLQLAHSSDGFIAKSGERTALTNPTSWQRIYQARANADAIMVGINTVLIDNPQLTSRTDKNPIRIIVDTHARLPLTSTLAQTAKQTPVWLLTAAQSPALEALGVKLIQCPLEGGWINLKSALSKLDLATIICEGGAALAQSLNTDGLIDELILIESDIALGSGIPLPILTNFTPRDELRIATDTWRIYDARRGIM